MPRKRPQRRSSNFRLRLAVFAVLALAVVIAACGGGAAPASGRTITIEMSDFAFSPSAIDLAPGERVTLTFRNVGTVEHEFMAGSEPMMGTGYRQDWLAQAKPDAGKSHDTAHAGEGVRAAAKKSAELKLVVPAEKGEFEFGCFVAGHYEAGMKGKLVVGATAGPR